MRSFVICGLHYTLLQRTNRRLFEATCGTHEVDESSVITLEGNSPVGRPWRMWEDDVDHEDRMYGCGLDSTYDEVQ
jgi:hypothetical protein